MIILRYWTCRTPHQRIFYKLLKTWIALALGEAPLQNSLAARGFISHSVTGNSVACGITKHRRNSLAPPPHAAHQFSHILLWDCIPFLNQHLFQVSQRGSVGHSSIQFNWVEVWTHGRPFHPLHSQILEVLCDDPGSVGASNVILEGGIRSQVPKIWNLGPESHPCTLVH